jgi:transketolase
LYAALAQKGFFGVEEFKKLRHVGGMLQGYPNRLKIPDVEFNSGSKTTKCGFYKNAAGK